MTLIEVLVAVLVTSLGVLGVTGLQMTGLQANRAALWRAEAMLMALDMMERIRANATAADAVQQYAAVGLGDPPAHPSDCGTRDCTARELAAFDSALWKCRLGRFRQHSACAALIGIAGSGFVEADLRQPPLPDGDGGIAIGRQGRLASVRVQWREGGQVRSVTVAGRYAGQTDGPPGD